MPDGLALTSRPQCAMCLDSYCKPGFASLVR